MIFDIFSLILLDPMINFLVILNNVLFDSFGLAIIAFTIIVRTATFPLTLRQLRQSRALQLLVPKQQELQKKYSDPKRRQQELMKLYKEAGVNPLGCIGPMLLQFPILIALFYAVNRTLAVSPESLDQLSNHLYSWSYIQHSVPLQEHFLFFDLRHPNVFLVGLVGLATWAQSKTTVTVSTDERARAQQKMMTWMLPLMFMFFAFSVPSGVSLYWVITSVVSVIFNFATYGVPWLNIQPLISAPSPPGATQTADQGIPAIDGGPPARRAPTDHERNPSGIRRNKRKNRRRRP